MVDGGIDDDGSAAAADDVTGKHLLRMMRLGDSSDDGDRGASDGGDGSVGTGPDDDADSDVAGGPSAGTSVIVAAHKRKVVPDASESGSSLAGAGSAESSVAVSGTVAIDGVKPT